VQQEAPAPGLAAAIASINKPWLLHRDKNHVCPAPSDLARISSTSLPLQVKRLKFPPL